MEARERTGRRLAFAAVAALLLAGLTQNGFVDPDLWHELALAREAWHVGGLPLRDDFAFTPTVVPVVHHEWGTGALLWAVVSAFGGAGLLVVRYLLVAALALLAWRAARRRGAHWTGFAVLAPVAVVLSWFGFSTVRAQMFTLVMCAWLLLALGRDRDGDRRWIPAWLVGHVIWVNLHAGFVVGLIWVLAHGTEEFLRHRPWRHLAGVALAMAALVLVNPYGTAYVSYLGRALVMDRPLITEWAPVWAAFGPVIAIFAVSLLVAVYAVWRRGWSGASDVLILALAAYAAARHQRHLALYAVAWVVLVPSWLEPTPLGRAVRELWSSRPRVCSTAALVVALVCSGAALRNRPWELDVPANPGDHPLLTYPVGAVDYLRETGFAGNALTGFDWGAYVSFQLYPAVRVSMDGRYEVAYPRGSLEDTRAIYAAEEGWRERLARYAPDVVLAPAGGRLAGGLAETADWTRCYRDDAFEVFARPGLGLPVVDARGRELVGVFP